MGTGEQDVEVAEGSKSWIDILIVGHVITAVGHRRPVERRQPDSVDAQLGELWQPRSDAAQITHAGAVGVGKAAHVDLIDHSIAPPALRGASRFGHENSRLFAGRRIGRRLQPTQHRSYYSGGTALARATSA